MNWTAVFRDVYPGSNQKQEDKINLKKIIYHFVTLMNEDKKCQKSIATGG